MNRWHRQSCLCSECSPPGPPLPDDVKALPARQPSQPAPLLPEMEMEMQPEPSVERVFRPSSDLEYPSFEDRTRFEMQPAPTSTTTASDKSAGQVRQGVGKGVPHHPIPTAKGTPTPTASGGPPHKILPFTSLSPKKDNTPKKIKQSQTTVTKPIRGPRYAIEEIPVPRERKRKRYKNRIRIHTGIEMVAAGYRWVGGFNKWALKMRREPIRSAQFRTACGFLKELLGGRLMLKKVWGMVPKDEQKRITDELNTADEVMAAVLAWVPEEMRKYPENIRGYGPQNNRVSGRPRKKKGAVESLDSRADLPQNGAEPKDRNNG